MNQAEREMLSIIQPVADREGWTVKRHRWHREYFEIRRAGTGGHVVVRWRTILMYSRVKPDGWYERPAEDCGTFRGRGWREALAGELASVLADCLLAWPDREAAS